MAIISHNNQYIMEEQGVRWNDEPYDDNPKFEYYCQSLKTGEVSERVLYTHNRTNLYKLMDIWNHSEQWKYWSK